MRALSHAEINVIHGGVCPYRVVCVVLTATFAALSSTGALTYFGVSDDKLPQYKTATTIAAIALVLLWYSASYWHQQHRGDTSKNDINDENIN